MKRSEVIKAFIVLAILVVFATGYYKFMTREDVPAENTYRLANQYLEDGKHEEAIAAFDEALAVNPSYAAAFMGKGITLMQMQRWEESGAAFDRAIELDDAFAVAYANRGILNDRIGRYEEALHDYRKALSLKPELAKGPGWLWRFLRNIQEKPPTIADRAKYLEEELNKPESERLLRVPEIDAQQRMYTK